MSAGGRGRKRRAISPASSASRSPPRVRFAADPVPPPPPPPEGEEAGPILGVNYVDPGAAHLRAIDIMTTLRAPATPQAVVHLAAVQAALRADSALPVMVREAAASIIATAAAQPTPALREAAAIGYLAVLESRCVAYFAMALTSEATRTLRSRLAEARGAIPDYGYAQVASWARDVIPREIRGGVNRASPE